VTVAFPAMPDEQGSLSPAGEFSTIVTGLFIVGYADGGWPRLASGGAVIGFGVAGMH
jgi:NO-binding membrane sensor protein with MHYT domain